MVKKRLVKLTIFSLLLVFFVGVKNVSAKDDNIGWEFTIYAEHTNSYSYSRYRETSSVANPWKVQLKTSGEGKGTITTFWLAKQIEPYYWQQVSVTRNVKQGAAPTTSGAYKSANKSHVSLADENNNYSVNSYWATGIWDEETW